MSQLIIFGTGYATATRCYNTCFAIKSDEGVFLVDAGGGNEILKGLRQRALTLGISAACLLLTAIQTI